MVTRYRWKCVFCSTKNSSDRKQCRTCLAPVEKARTTKKIHDMFEEVDG